MVKRHPLLFVFIFYLALVQNASWAQKSSSDEAYEFIKSRLTLVQSNVDSNYWSWSPIEVKLAAHRWSWIELQTSIKVDILTRTALAATTNEVYSLSPVDLTYPVTVNGNRIKFECRSVKCIKVVIDSRLSKMVNEKTENVVDPIVSEEQRSSNSWYFRDEDTAKRVARAMNDALVASGATKSTY